MMSKVFRRNDAENYGSIGTKVQAKASNVSFTLKQPKKF